MQNVISRALWSLALMISIFACNPKGTDAWDAFTACGSTTCVEEVLAVKDAFLKDAIVAVGSGKAVKVTSSKSVGCSIKRVD